jgi:hypothetical protein
MGTTSVELILPKIVQVLGPDGEFERGRITRRAGYAPILAESQKITVIASADDAANATSMGRLLQAESKELESFFKEIKRQIDAVKAPVLAAEKSDTLPIEAEKSRLGALQIAWTQAERKKQEERDRQARAEADREAQEAILQRAIEHESLGDMDAAEATLAEAPVASPVATLSKVSKPSGSVSKVNYSARVTNLLELVKAVASGKVPVNALSANESFLNNQAKQFREAFSVPGVELVRSENLHYRS